MLAGYASPEMSSTLTEQSGKSEKTDSSSEELEMSCASRRHVAALTDESANSVGLGQGEVLSSARIKRVLSGNSGTEQSNAPQVGASTVQDSRGMLMVLRRSRAVDAGSGETLLFASPRASGPQWTLRALWLRQPSADRALSLYDANGGSLKVSCAKCGSGGAAARPIAHGAEASMCPCRACTTDELERAVTGLAFGTCDATMHRTV